MVRPETIFVVEDDILYLNLINKELEKMGYTKIESYSTGKEAMHNLDKKPDIALLDYFLEKDLFLFSYLIQYSTLSIKTSKSIFLFPLSAHSHILRTHQPSCFNNRSFLRSLNKFLWIFSFQNFLRVLGQ